MQLVITEVSRIQPYIFASNRMRENVGASYLVVQATEDWAIASVGEVAPRNNVSSKDGKPLEEGKRIEDPADRLDAEVVYAGGGNFAVLFRDQLRAKEFVQKLSRRLLTEAPGLELVVARVPFQWTDSLSRTMRAGFKELEEKKRAWVPSVPLLGLGVTVMCRSTGLPAVAFAGIEEEQYPVSAEVLAKVANLREARERLKSLLPPPVGYEYPENLDDLGRSFKEYSYIAVVHIDGNDMGQRKMEIGEEYKDPSRNRDYIVALRAFSSGVKEAAERALQRTISRLVDRLKQDGGNCIKLYSDINPERKGIARLELKEAAGGKWYLPILPIVYGGDDLTFVSDGRLGISLALAYVRAFEEETAKRPQCRGRVTSCAGIAVVKSHFPFAEAYRLTEELCRSAKNYRRRNDLEGSCLDWHFALSGFTGSLEEIRRREYKIEEIGERSGKAGARWLTLRPVTLEENPKESHRAWPVVRRGIEGFRQADWIGRRNKLKALREALRAGPEAVEEFRLGFEIGELPEVEPSLTDWPRRGWQGDRCGYFDAIELVDWFIPLEGER